MSRIFTQFVRNKINLSNGNYFRARGQLLLADDIMNKMDTLRALTKDI